MKSFASVQQINLRWQDRLHELWPRMIPCPSPLDSPDTICKLHNFKPVTKISCILCREYFVIVHSGLFITLYLNTLRVSRRRCEMYIGHARLCVCLSLASLPHYCTNPDVTWRSGSGYPLVVHYWTDLQSVHGSRCYDNIAQTWIISKCLYSLYAWFL